MPRFYSGLHFRLFTFVVLFLLGGATFIRQFNNGDAGYISMAFASVIWYAHKHRSAEKEKKRIEECMLKQNESLEDELSQQRGLCSTLEYVKSALESKSQIEKLAHIEKQSLQQEVKYAKDQTCGYKKELEEMKRKNASLTQELAARKCETTRHRQEFKKKLEKFECAIQEVKSLECERNELKRQLCEAKKTIHDKNECVKTLKSTVEALAQQRTQLMEKFSGAIKQLGEVKQENRNLMKTMNCQKNLRKQETDKIGEIEQLTQKLQSSLSHAKGRLSRAGGKLATADAPGQQQMQKSFDAPAQQPMQKSFDARAQQQMQQCFDARAQRQMQQSLDARGQLQMQQSCDEGGRRQSCGGAMTPRSDFY